MIAKLGGLVQWLEETLPDFNLAMNRPDAAASARGKDSGTRQVPVVQYSYFSKNNFVRKTLAMGFAAALSAMAGARDYPDGRDLAEAQGLLE